MRPFLAILAIALMGVTLIWQVTDGARAVTAEGARRLHAVERTPTMPSPYLTDMSGKTVRLQPDVGGVALVEFIYTACPTICRYAGDSFARLKGRLAAAGLAKGVRMFSVSFDPLRDDPMALSDYAETHGADGDIWKVGAPAVTDLRGLLSGYGVTVIADRFDGYEHNAAIHLIDERNRLVGIFDIDDIDGVVEAIRR